MKQSSSLLFFGSGPVAAATLKGLKDHFTFEAIITKPRVPGFRGDVPVVDIATAWNIPCFTPRNKAELSELFTNHVFTSPLGLVVDYGIIISKNVINAFERGILNSHFSLLPEWRGADPITFAVLSGQEKSGISLMLINESMDEGDLIDQEALELPPNITTQKLTDSFIKMSNSLLIKNIPEYLTGIRTTYPQPDREPTYSRKIKKEDGLLDLHKPARTLEREVRAYLGWPKSFINLFGHQIIVTKARVAESPDDGSLVLSCAPGWLEILELIAPSGRKMAGADFLRGYKKS